MKPSPPALAPLLRSDRQGELLALHLLQPDRTFSLTEIAELLHAPLSSIKVEVDRLVEGGLLSESRLGNVRQLRVDHHNPMVRPLTELIELSYAPPAVLQQELSGLPGITSAIIFGSWAARRLGERGKPPVDIDVLVVGETPMPALLDAAERAASRLHREVNVQRVSDAAWTSGASSFILQVRSSPRIEIDLS